jgi:hypothetical protein
MVKVYAIVLSVGVGLLVVWILATNVGGNVPAWRGIDPEERFATGGRRIVAGLVGFGLAGMSAEFSPFDLSWPMGLVLATVGGAAMAWYAGWVDRPRPSRRRIGRTGTDQS